MGTTSSTYSLSWNGDEFAQGANTTAASADKAAAAVDRLTNATKKIAKIGKPPIVDDLRSVIVNTGKLPNAAPKLTENARAAGVAAVKVDSLSKSLETSANDIAGFLGHGKTLITLFQKLASGPLGAAVAIAVLTAAVVAATAAFVHFALASADAVRSQRLLAEAATGSAKGAAMLAAHTRAIADSTGLSNEQVTKIGTTMAKAGLAGRDLANAMRASAIATSALGDEAGGKIAGIAEEAAKLRALGGKGGLALNKQLLLGTGVNMDQVALALAERTHVSLKQAKAALMAGKTSMTLVLDVLETAVNRKLGRIAKMQALALPKQFQRLRENVQDLFAGANIEAFLESLHGVLTVFDATTVSGRGLKAAITAIAQPLIDAFSGAGPLAKAFFQGMIIAALQVAVLLLKLRKWVKETFDAPGIDGVTVALMAGKLAVFGLAAAVLMLGTVLAVVMAPLAALGAAVYYFLQFLQQLGAAIDEAEDYLLSINFGAIGTRIIEGLANGIRAGKAAVLGAVTDLGTDLKDAFANLLGIHSPSVVFRGYGENTALGYAQGVESAAPEARAATEGLVGGPPGNVQRAGGHGSRVLHIENLNISGVKDAHELAEPSFRERFIRVLEEAAIGIGSPLPEPEGA